jgi:hypothetical protein
MKKLRLSPEDQAWLDSYCYRDTLPLVSSIIVFGSKARIP